MKYYYYYYSCCCCCCCCYRIYYHSSAYIAAVIRDIERHIAAWGNIIVGPLWSEKFFNGTF